MLLGFFLEMQNNSKYLVIRERERRDRFLSTTGALRKTEEDFKKLLMKDSKKTLTDLFAPSHQ